MNGNGSKTSRKPRVDDRPWWHSGSKCVAMLFWVFTLAVTWQGTFGCGWTRSSGLLLMSSLMSSILVSGVAMTLERQE